MDFQSISDDDEEDGAELFFEGPDAEVAATPAVATDTPAAAKARKKAAASPPPPAPAGEPEAVAISLPELAGPDPAPADAPPAPAGATIPRRVTIALVLAVVASLFSAIGLLVVTRNLSVLAGQQAEAEQRAAAFDRLPALLAEVEKLAAEQRAELARNAAAHPSALVTPDELSRQLNGLRFALAKSQAPGTATLAGVVRQGQVELTHRIDQVNDRIDAIQTKRGGH